MFYILRHECAPPSSRFTERSMCLADWQTFSKKQNRLANRMRYSFALKKKGVQKEIVDEGTYCANIASRYVFLVAEK